MKYLTLILIFSLYVTNSLGQDNVVDDPIDSAYSACMEKDGSTIGMIDCMYQANQHWENLMNKYFNLLIKNCETKEEKESLKSSQSIWIKFRDAELSVNNTIFNLDGTMWPIVKAENAMNVVKIRAIQFRKYYETLTQH